MSRCPHCSLDSFANQVPSWVLSNVSGGVIMSKFLRNAWYAICWSEELTPGKLLPFKLLDDDLTLFRRQDGSVAALFDMCPHRFAPLSKGKIVGDSVQCGYHGLCFDGAGACTHNPFSEKIPAAAKVRSFAARERDEVIWVWGGDAADADDTLLPSLPHLHTKTGSRTVRGLTPVAGHYELGNDNLMDLSHVEFLHGQAFGTTSQADAIKTVKQEGDHVIMDWWMPNTIAAPGFDPIFETGDALADVWLTIRWQPAASLVLEVGTSLAGVGRENGRRFLLTNLLTPESETSYRYLWAASRTDKIDSDIVDQVLLGVLKHAFDIDDAPMIAACTARMKGRSLWDMKPLLLETDAGAVRVRRVLADLIAKQNTAVAVSS